MARKSMLRSFVAALALFAAAQAAAQEDPADTQPKPAGPSSARVKCENGLQIYIDGRFAGFSTNVDMLLDYLPPGRHQLKAVKRGYLPKFADFETRPSEMAVVEIAGEWEADESQRLPDGSLPGEKGKEEPAAEPEPEEEKDFFTKTWSWGMKKVDETMKEWRRSKSIKLDDQVGTPIRKPQSLRHVTQAVTLIRQQEIGSKGVQYLDQLMVNQSAVEVWNQGWWGSSSKLSIRGTYPMHALVVFEDRPLNALWDGVCDTGWIPLFAAESVEVVKGPGSHVWGSGAMGGVVQVRTIEPSDEFRGTGGGMIWSRDSFEVRGFTSWKLGNLGYFVGGAVRKTLGFRDNSDFASDDNFIKLVYDVQPGKFQVKYSNWIHRDHHGLPGPVPDPDFPTPLFGSASASSVFDDDKQTLVANTVNAEYEVNDTTMIRATFYQDYRWYRTKRRMWSNLTSQPSANYYAFHDNSILGFSLRADLDDNVKDHKISLAFEYRNEAYKFHNNEVAVYDTFNPDPESIQSQAWALDHSIFGFWATDQWAISKQLSMVGGVRFDFHSRAWNQDGYHLGLAWQMDEFTAVRGSLSRGYRFPSFFELYYDPAGVSHPWADVNMRVPGNQNLTAEKIWAAELGAATERKIKDVPLLGEMGLFAQASIFYHFLVDQIDSMPPAGVDSVSNLHRKVLWGSELSIRAHPASFLLLDFNATWYWANGYQVEATNALTGENSLVWRRADRVPSNFWRFEAIINSGLGFKVIYFARYTGSRTYWAEDFAAFPVITQQKFVVNETFEHGIYFSYDFLGVATFYVGYTAFPQQTPTGDLDDYYTSPSMQASYPTPQDSFTVGVSAGGTF